MQNRKLLYVIWIILFFTLSRLLVGCIFRCDCPETILNYIAINSCVTQAIDNSGSYVPYQQNVDSIPRAAIGFKVELTDTAFQYDYYLFGQAPRVVSGFNTASAFECECNYHDFQLASPLSEIQVNTLFEFSPTYPKGSDITEIMLSDMESFKKRYDGLYWSLDQLLSSTSIQGVLDNAVLKFSLFLKEEAKNDSLQLELIFKFEDGSCISDTTQLVFPI